MERSLDGLIRHLLVQIALCGEHGMCEVLTRKRGFIVCFFDHFVLQMCLAA